MNPDSQLKPLERFWRLLRQDKRDISSLYGYAVFSGIVNLSLPLGVQAIINFIQLGQLSASWFILILVVLLGVVLTGILQLLQLRVIENLQQRLFTRAAFEFAFRMPRIHFEQLYKHYAPELMNRFFDTLSVQKGLSKLLLNFTTATLQVAFGVILLSIYHPFFLVFCILLLALMVLLFRPSAKRGLDTSLDESKYKYKVAHWLEELARAKDTFKLAGKTAIPLNRTDDNVIGYLKSREAHFQVLRHQHRLLILFKTLMTAGLLVVGSLLVFNQQLNIGQFVAAEIIIFMLISSVEKLVTGIESIYDVLSALEKLGQVTDLDLEEAHHSETFLPNLKLNKGFRVDLNQVAYQYPDANRVVFENITFRVLPNEKVYLNGANGSGKSTMMHLLAGLYKPSSGSIAINELPFNNYPIEELRLYVGNTLKEESIFLGSLYENITLGRPELQIHDVLWAIEHVGLQQAIKELPDGLQTIIDPLGHRYSKSFNQRLLLARSIVHKPKLLLLENSVELIEDKLRKTIIDFLTSDQTPWTLIATTSDAYFRAKCSRGIDITSPTY